MAAIWTFELFNMYKAYVVFLITFMKTKVHFEQVLYYFSKQQILMSLVNASTCEHMKQALHSCLSSVCDKKNPRTLKEQVKIS